MSAPTAAFSEVLRVTRSVPKSLQFLVSGGLGYLLGAALLFLFIDGLGLADQPSFVLQAGITCAFVWALNRYVTWHEHDGSTARTLSTFVAYRVGGMVLAWAIFTASVNRDLPLWPGGEVTVPIHYQLANALGVGCATVCNYVACRYVIFAEHSTRETGVGPAKAGRYRHVVLALIVAVALTVSIVALPLQTLLVAWMLNAILLITVAVANVSRMLYGWQRPERVDHVALDDLAPPATTFSLIVPARHEPILQQTLLHLLATDYPAELFEVLVVIGDDDPATQLLARQVEERYANVQVVIDYNPIKNKPLALETARALAWGDVIGVVDAESILATGLLDYVNTLASTDESASIFQGGVQLMNNRAASWQRPQDAGLWRSAGDWLNTGTSWWRARNCLEYYVWFMSRLRYQAAADFVPLGGNTVFVRRDALTELGGWDPACLTEDCELGVRASTAGLKTVVFYHPDLVTREETPESLSGLIRQRTRWMSGFIQVLRKRSWAELPMKKKLFAVEALTTPLFQAYAGVASIVSVALAVILDAPVGLVVFSFVPLIVTVINVGFEHAAYRELTSTFQLPTSKFDSVRFVVMSPIYQLVLSAAAVRSVSRMVRGLTAWEKTAHAGQHLVPSVLTHDVVADLQAAS